MHLDEAPGRLRGDVGVHAEQVRRVVLRLEFRQSLIVAAERATDFFGVAVSPLTSTTAPELSAAIAHLREVLGDRTYESLARKGETMTAAAMATYAYDQIDQARAELNAVSK